MRKLTTALVLALIATLTFSTVALAWGDYDVSVECSDITVDTDGFVGSDATASGTVTATATAKAWGFISKADAFSSGQYVVLTPDFNVADQGWAMEHDYSWGWCYAKADTSLVFDWTSTFTLSEEGTWLVGHNGFAWAWWSAWFGCQEDEGWDYDALWAEIEAKNRPAGTYGSRYTYGWRFLAVMGGYDYHDYYKWVEEPNPGSNNNTNGRTLAEPIELVGKWYNRNHNPYERVYVLTVPAGTEIVGYYGHQGTHISVEMHNGEPRITPNLKLNKPATIYEVVNGECVEVLRFNQAFCGEPSLADHGDWFVVN